MIGYRATRGLTLLDEKVDGGNLGHALGAVIKLRQLGVEGLKFEKKGLALGAGG